MLTFLRGAGVMSSKSDVIKAKLSKLKCNRINAACETLLQTTFPNKATKM